MYQMFSFFDIKETQGRAMCIADLLNIELPNDKQSKQVFGPLPLNKVWLKRLLENWNERQLRRSNLMKNALSL